MSNNTTVFSPPIGDVSLPITPTQVGGGTVPGNFTALTALSMDNTPVGQNTPVAGSFTTLSCTTLTTSAVAALAASPLSTLTTAQIAALTTTQLAGFTTTQISALNALFLAKSGAP